ncbi:hypothetical protein CH292_27455 [Rhodococcus sp. 14-2470-1a]|nr:hypothetical protein CH292_27455 [Rhodococcus sp. 14-2470-1a]
MLTKLPSRQSRIRSMLAIAGVTALMLVSPSIALAAPDDPAIPEPSVPSDVAVDEVPLEYLNTPGAEAQCIDEAVSVRKLESWTCMGPILSSDGVTEVLPVEPRPDLAPAPAPQRRDLPDPDDYDTWCEEGQISCPRVLESGFGGEVKFNFSWGDDEGAQGQWDYIIRTNLNGRQAQWTTTMILENGPALTFQRSEIHCREVVPGPYPDSNCGIHYAGSPFTIRDAPNQRRFSNGPIYGNRLDDAGTYFAEGRGQYSAEGFEYALSIPTYPKPPETGRFVCPTNNGRCYFNPS